MSSLSPILFPSRPSNVPMTSAIAWSKSFVHTGTCWFQFSSKRQKHNLCDVCLDCFKPPASRSRAYCDCNPIRAFETFEISKKPSLLHSRFCVVTQRSSPLTLVTSTRFLSVENNEANSAKKITHFKISLRYYYLVGLINE